MHNIVLTGDWHISNKEDASFVSSWLKKHLTKKDELILMGDLVDTGLSQGMGWDQDSVNKQLIYLKKILESYTLLGYVSGNHERRIHKKAGLNPYQLLYGEETTEYMIDGIVRINIQHGKSGAQNQALELGRLAQTYPDADIVALGHTHDLGIYMLPHQVIGLRTGSLQRYPDYAKRSIMIPKTLGCIRFYPEQFKFEMVYK